MQYPSFEEEIKEREELSKVSYEHWVHHDFLTWKWWLLLILTVLPWYVWWRIRDKQRTQEILLYGLVIAFLAFFLDNIGTGLLWWSYPDKLIQMVPMLVPADFTLVPTMMMIGYQIFNNYKSFLIGNLVLGLFMSFVGGTLFIKLGFYELYSWRHYYSLLFYIISAHIARFIVIKTRAKETKG